MRIPSYEFHPATSRRFHRADSIVRILVCGFHPTPSYGLHYVDFIVRIGSWHRIVRSHIGIASSELYCADLSLSAVLIENCADRAHNLLKYEVIHWMIEALQENLSESSQIECLYTMNYPYTVIGLIWSREMIYEDWQKDVLTARKWPSQIAQKWTSQQPQKGVSNSLKKTVTVPPESDIYKVVCQQFL